MALPDFQSFVMLPINPSIKGRVAPKHLITAIVGITLLCVSLSAQTDNQAQTSPQIVAHGQGQSLKDSTIIALRAQIEIMQHYDNRLIATVYWALGFTGVLLTLIVGLGWYTNFRIYKSDLESAKTELGGLFKDSSRKLRKELNQEFDNFKQRDRTEKKAFAENTSADIKYQIKPIDTELRRLDIELLSLEAKFYEEKGSYGIALILYIILLEKSIDSESEYALNSYLEKIREQLDLIKTVDIEEETKLSKQLSRLASDYQTVVDNIKILITKKIAPLQ